MKQAQVTLQDGTKQLVAEQCLVSECLLCFCVVSEPPGCAAVAPSVAAA